MTPRKRGLRGWLSTFQGKLIIASLAISLVPTAIAAEMTVRLVMSVIDSDLEPFLSETSDTFLANFKEAQREAATMAHYLYDQKKVPGDPVIRADDSFLHMTEALGYGVVITYEKQSRKILYSNYPVRRFEPLPAEVDNTLYSLQLPSRSLVLSGGTFGYQVDGKEYEILVGNWLDENFIESLKSVSSLDLRLYLRRTDGFRMIYSSRSGLAAGSPLPDGVLTGLAENSGRYYDPEAEDGSFRVLYHPIRNASGELVGVMSSGLKSSEVPTIANLPLQLIATVFLSGALLTALAGVIVSRRLSRPLRRLTQGVRSITEGDYKHRVSVSGDDEVNELAGVFNHMAERLEQLHSLEAELRRRDRLSALGEVAVGIAHEVRNPLGTIKTSAELVRKRDNLSAGDAKLLGYVIDEVRRINNLIDDFLSFARPRAPVIRNLPLSAVVERVSSFCEPELARNGIELTVQDDCPGAMVAADEDHLFQAVLNLVLNAIDAMAKGGRLSIRLGCENGLARLSFTDTGPGIPPDIQEKIFNPFFTTKPRGTGLGLAKVFSVMESHQGRVECQSLTGQGATFTLVLPLSEG